jgi:dephospho-CoA kinase
VLVFPTLATLVYFVLLSGRPGTGKTFLAACIASEAQLPFIYIDASSLRGMFIGMTELMVMAVALGMVAAAGGFCRRGLRLACGIAALGRLGLA